MGVCCPYVRMDRSLGLSMRVNRLTTVLVAYALDLVGRRSEQQLEVKCA